MNLRGFVLKVAISGSHQTSVDVMQELGAVLTYGTVPGAPLSNGKTFFALHLYLARRFCKTFQTTRGPTQCKSGLIDNMVSKRNYLLYTIFSITVRFHLASL